MSVYSIGDLHLSFSCDKPMDFFKGWENYTSRLAENWKNTVTDADTVILPGDFSWATTLEEALADFKFVDALPGRKILLKGNHDFWWNSLKKTTDFWQEHNMNSFSLLQNNSIPLENMTVCGTRGWFFDDAKDYSEKIDRREALRLKMSLDDALKNGYENPIVFLHFPPIFADKVSGSLIDIMREYGVKRCYYGHLHGQGAHLGFNGNAFGIEFQLVSADFLQFSPILVDI